METTQSLFEEAAAIQARFRTGGWFLGGFIGLIIGIKLIGLSVRRSRNDWEPDRITCFACGRCFPYCPQERQRHQKNNAPKNGENNSSNHQLKGMDET